LKVLNEEAYKAIDSGKFIDFVHGILGRFTTTKPNDASSKIYIGPGKRQLEVWDALFLGDENLKSLFADILLPTESEKKDKKTDKCIENVNTLTNIFLVIKRILFSDFFTVGPFDAELKNNTFEFSLEARQSLRVNLRHLGNLRLVQQLLKIRYNRRLQPTNKYSLNVKGGYNQYCRYACEYRYFECALMVCECEDFVDVRSVKSVFDWNNNGWFSRVYAVGGAGKVLDACKMFLV